MSYVPIPVIVPEADVSPRAKDLARNLEKSIQEFRQRNPSLSDAEIRQALTLMSQSRPGARAKSLVFALLAGVAMLGLGVFLYFARVG